MSCEVNGVFNDLVCEGTKLNLINADSHISIQFFCEDERTGINSSVCVCVCVFASTGLNPSRKPQKADSEISSLPEPGTPYLPPRAPSGVPEHVRALAGQTARGPRGRYRRCPHHYLYWPGVFTLALAQGLFQLLACPPCPPSRPLQTAGRRGDSDPLTHCPNKAVRVGAPLPLLSTQHMPQTQQHSIFIEHVAHSNKPSCTGNPG